MAVVSHNQFGESQEIGGKSGCQKETQNQVKAEILELDTGSLREPKAAQNSSSNVPAPDAKFLEEIEKLIKKYEDAKLKNAEAFIKQNIENMIDKANLTTDDANQAKELLSQATSGNLNASGDSNGTPEHHVGNFFLILFEFLRKNTQSNNEEMLATFQHMEGVSNQLKAAVKVLTTEQAKTEKNIQDQNAKEVKSKRKGLLGLILGIVLSVVLAVVTAGAGSALSSAGVAADAAEAAADLSEVGEAAGEAAEAVTDIAETSADSVTSTCNSVADSLEEQASTIEEQAKNLSGIAKNMGNTATRFASSVGSEAEQGSEVAAQTANRLRGLAEAFRNIGQAVEDGSLEAGDAVSEMSELGEQVGTVSEEASSSISNVSSMGGRMARIANAIKTASMTAKITASLTVLGIAGTTLGTGIPGVENSATSTRNTNVQQDLSAQQAVSQIESNRSDAANTSMQQDSQILQKDTTNNQSNTRLESETVNQMTQAQKLGSI